MKYKKLIEDLRLYMNDGDEEIRNKAADAIEDLDNKLNLYRQGENRHWIPVNERTPDKRGEYFVWGINLCTQYDDDREFAFVAVWDGEHFRSQRFTAITHWMPIPEPSESDGE